MSCRIAVWFVVSSVVLLLGGCTPKAPPAPVSSPAPPPSVAPQAPSGARNGATPGVGVQSGRIFDESLLRGKEFLLSASAVRGNLLAADDVLGDLATEAEGSVKAARALIQKVGQKKGADQELAPRWKEYLQVKLARWSAGPWNWNRVRFAVPKRPEEGGILLDFLVEGAPDQGRGQIYLSEQAEGTWLIEDLVLEPLGSPEPYQPEEVTSGPLVR